VHLQFFEKLQSLVGILVIREAFRLGYRHPGLARFDIAHVHNVAEPHIPGLFPE